MTENVLHTREVQSPGGTEKAIIVQANPDFSNLGEMPILRKTLEGLGLTVGDLKMLIDGDFPDADTPFDEELEEYKEQVNVRYARLNGRDIERSYVRREDWGEIPSSYDFQLRQKKEPAFKILVALHGEAILEIPEKVEPMGALYGASEEKDYVRFAQGAIAITEAPTASLFRRSKGNFEYLYISSPRYNESIDTKAINPLSK